MAPQSSGDGNQGPGQGDELYAEPKDEDAASADAASADAASADAASADAASADAEAEANRLLNESSADQSEEDRVLDDVLKETIRAVSGGRAAI